MANTDNIATRVVLEMRDELAALREARTPAQQFMTEKKSPADALKMIERMSPGARKELREKMGDDALRQIVTGRGS